MGRALVVGGTGQIGRAVVPALTAAGWQVDVLTRDPARHGPWLADAGATPVPGHRGDPAALAGALGAGVDLLVDVVAFDDRDAAAFLDRPGAVGAAVVVSSAAVYVDPDGHGFETDRFAAFTAPVGEAAGTVPPGRGSYARGKVALEHAWLGSPVPTTVLRPAAVHGPWSTQPREWLLVRRVLDGRDVRVLAHDGRSRFATTAAAAVGALVAAAAADPADRVLNVADADAPTVTEIARAVDAALGVTSRVVGLPGPPRGDLGRTPWSVPHDLVLDTGRARALLPAPPAPYAQAVVPAARWLAARGRDATYAGFARLEGGGDLFDYAAEDAWLAQHDDGHDL